MGKASPKELVVFEKRLQVALSFARPTRPAKVYLWKLAGDLDGDLPEDLYWLEVRVPVAARAVGELWPIYPTSHKVYDARVNEWDICPALAPEDDLDDQELFEDYSGPPVAVSLPGGAVKESTFYDAELRSFYEDGEHHGYRPTLEVFSNVSRFRYGLIPEIVELADIAYDKYNAINIRKFFGLVHEDMDEETVKVIKPASGFVDQMLRNPQAPWAPGLIWDLEESCDHCILTAMSASSILLYNHDIDDARHIEVQYTSDLRQPWWSLFVDDTTALELCRRRGITRLQDAVSFLIRRGSRIILAWQPNQRDLTGMQLFDPPPVYLGWRRSGFSPDGWDYMEYEQQARELLSQPRGRAAILRGGIVWRLAVELLGEHGLREAGLGPSADVWRHGREIFAKRGDSWYADSLSDYELDVICGVYKVYTRMCDSYSASHCYSWPYR